MLKKRLVDAMDTVTKISKRVKPLIEQGCHPQRVYAEVLNCIAETPTVDAVEVVRIEEVKKEILQGFDVLIAEYQRISQSSKDYFGIKADAMEIARRLVNAALTDLCTNCGAEMDGGNEDGC